MALSASGSISFSQISNEFGLPSGRNLGAYRIRQSVGTLSNLPLDTGIPSSGSISFSNFRGKRLNTVVDLFSIPQNSSRRVARNRYNNNFVIVIGGFRSRPSSSNGTKVYINVNQRIGSAKGNRNNVALQTGSWDSNTELIMVVGPNGSLMGAGGDGGGGGTGTGSGGSGTSGTSGLGIQYTTSIINQGFIFGGRGGGGGGGAGAGFRCSRSKRGCKGRTDFRTTGGGGAGGRGFPAGTGGPGGNAGTSGTVDSNGTGGAGTTISGNQPAVSGAGGSIEQSGQPGNGGGGGAGGQRGYAIVISPGAGYSYSGSGILAGSAVSGNPT
jgi:hypothetical protein